MKTTKPVLAILFDVPPYHAALFFNLTDGREVQLGGNQEFNFYGQFFKTFESFEAAMNYAFNLKKLFPDEIVIDMNLEGTVYIEYQRKQLYFYTGARAAMYAAHYNYNLEQSQAASVWNTC